MVLEIVKYGDPVLRQKGAPIRRVDDTIRDLAENMLETMYDANGVGLAAQQVGHALQLTVIDAADIEDRPSRMWIGGRECPMEEKMPLILLNPKIETGGEPETGVEGCLSFPEITGDITRPSRVRVTAHQLDGTRLEFEAEGLLARAVQHEFDHLQGVLFIDRMNSAAKASLAGRLKRMKAEQAEQAG